MITIASFPLISALEFESACRKISERYQAGGHLQSDWEHVRLAQGYEESTVYLSITRTIQGAGGKPESPVKDNGELEAFEEIDEEALQLRVPANHGLMVEYDIVLSPTYQVPVLYFRIRDAGCALPPSIDTLYRYVIPKQFKSQVESFGIIGGITMTEHPVTNLPVFFVHPCNTAAALEASFHGREITSEQYMQLWIGTVGWHVGLRVPIAIASDKTDHLSAEING
ncbi:uncharacterized protein K441DRAFT_557173 [Cenococcum geophilum 1.58]|uniref:uncharacterized protein n=1 Tax=Cenococcum geophilum 1.58 TaxID=794803 RepID=UPI00358DF1B0|nr:hypothetical protein K441DRAFT_557173 [Cenococcum geophilum 1.58]